MILYQSGINYLKSERSELRVRMMKLIYIYIYIYICVCVCAHIYVCIYEDLPILSIQLITLQSDYVGEYSDRREVQFHFR